MRRVCSYAIGAILLASAAWAQGTGGTIRLRGEVRDESGQPVASARVQAEATAGLNGGQFAGQRLIGVDANKKGECAIIGLQRGIWLFKASSADHLPHVVGLSVFAMQATASPTAPWPVSLQIRPRSALPKDAPGLQDLLVAADHAAAGKKADAFNALSRVARPDLSPDIACAAGDIALFFNEPAIARQFFDRVVAAKPEWFRGHLGIASAALVQTDYENAGRAFAKARDLAPNELKQALSATVGELQKITGYR